MRGLIFKVIKFQKEKEDPLRATLDNSQSSHVSSFPHDGFFFLSLKKRIWKFVTFRREGIPFVQSKEK